jgi:hypothetical protein
MAAGLGFKDFTTGEVLTAADVDGYLMQGVWVFASAAARDAAVTSPQEGNFAYLKDTNVTTYYTGSAWANLDTTGMTNPMTTTGDTIYSSSGSTPARLGIGSTGQVLTVAGGLPSWATPAGGGSNFTLLNAGGTSLSGSSNVTVSGISGADKIYVVFRAVSMGSATGCTIRFNSDTTNVYYQAGMGLSVGASYSAADLVETLGGLTGSNGGFTFGSIGSTAGEINGACYLNGGNSSGIKPVQVVSGAYYTSGTASSRNVFGNFQSTSTISSVSIVTAGSFDSGTMFVYTSA